jgi:aspartate-semialdehyde dehydrogenase
MVGEAMRSILVERSFPTSSIRFFASPRSAGRKIAFAGREVTVEAPGTADFKGMDIALFSAGATTSRALAPKVAAAGAIIVDNSSAFRMDPAIPLVVSEVNPGANEQAMRKGGPGIIANPNCTTMAAMPVLKPLLDEAGLIRMIATTYQAVSGGGAAGVAELEHQLDSVGEMSAKLARSGDAVAMPAPVHTEE